MAKFEPVNGKYVHIEVQRVDYRVYYEASGRGIPLLCQHTAGADGLQWRHLMNDVDVTSRFRVIAADLPYHGKSLPPESVAWWRGEYRLTRSFFIDFLVEFSHALELEKPIFMGRPSGDLSASTWRWNVPTNSGLWWPWRQRSTAREGRCPGGTTRASITTPRPQACGQ